MSQPEFQPLGYQNTEAYAGFWLRFLAYWIDFAILFPVGFVFGVGLTIIKIMMPSGMHALIGLGQFLIGILLNWLYHALMESSDLQATLGKKVLKLKVTDAEGQRITFLRATGRYFGKFVSSITLLIGYFMAGFTPKKQALHDIMADTLVIKSE